jgi:hypothetical protein
MGKWGNGEMGKWTHFGVHGHAGDVPDLISAVAAREFSRQIHGASGEKTLRVLVVVFLVVLDC